LIAITLMQHLHKITGGVWAPVERAAPALLAAKQTTREPGINPRPVTHKPYSGFARPRLGVFATQENACDLAARTRDIIMSRSKAGPHLLPPNDGADCVLLSVNATAVSSHRQTDRQI